MTEDAGSNSDAEKEGAWEPIRYRFKHLPVHIALLHTGKVLAFGGSGNDPKYLKNPHPPEIFEPDNDGGGTGRVYEISQEGIEGDIFCAGHAFLPDGRLLVTGGTHKYNASLFGKQIPIPPFRGLEHSYIFDPLQLKWSRAGNMAHGRWYPTCVLLSDGRVLTMAGLTKNFPWVFLNKLELFSEDTSWQELPGLDRWLPLYPRLHLLPSGEVFYAGSFNTHYTFPFTRVAFPSATLNVEARTWTTIGNPKNLNREEGTTVLLPLNWPNYTARVLLIAGGTPAGTDAIDEVEMIDFSENPPHYNSIQKLTHARYYAYPVLLPDGNVLVIGGKKGPKKHDEKEEHHVTSEKSHCDVPQNRLTVREPELFNTKEGKWYPMAQMKVDRLYHSNALLLPDGRVMTAGSNPERGTNELCIEIFRPPYLFRGERPKISKSPIRVSHGQTFEIESDDAKDIRAVALMRPSATTHCVDPEQRCIGLEYDQKNSKTLSATVPLNKNLAPVGYYMLFIIREGDIPSKAPFILVS